VVLAAGENAAFLHGSTYAEQYATGKKCDILHIVLQMKQREKEMVLTSEEKPSYCCRKRSLTKLCFFVGREGKNKFMYYGPNVC
jgi:hypothetical protein